MQWQVDTAAMKVASKRTSLHLQCLPSAEKRCALTVSLNQLTHVNQLKWTSRAWWLAITCPSTIRLEINKAIGYGSIFLPIHMSRGTRGLSKKSSNPPSVLRCASGTSGRFCSLLAQLWPEMSVRQFSSAQHVQTFS